MAGNRHPLLILEIGKERVSMAFCYDNLKLDKGMYQEAGSTFTQVLQKNGC